MAIGNEIALVCNGRKLEGYVSGTPKPGTMMQIKGGVAPKGGRLTWEAYDTSADGEQRLVAVLDIDALRGRTNTEAYADGDRCFLIIPAVGDELNVLISKAGTGAADAVAIGDLFIINDGDGLLVATTGTPESEPFVAIEAVADVVSDGTLVACMFTGY